MCKRAKDALAKHQSCVLPPSFNMQGKKGEFQYAAKRAKTPKIPRRASVST